MTLARQLWLLILVPIAAALALYGFLAHETRRRVLMDEASDELRNHASLLEAVGGRAVETGEMEVLKRRFERLAHVDRILGLAAFDARGGTILVTDRVASATPELAVVAARAFARAGDVEEERTLEGGPALIRTVMFSTKSGAPTVVAMVVRDLDYVDALARRLDQGLALTGALLLLVTALIAAVASRVTVGTPAGAIVAGAERVAAGNLKSPVPEQGAKEMARLARAFNAMTASLAEARARAEREEGARVAVERKLQHAQALAAVGQVAASIGHEIGSPLGVILGRARRAASQVECTEALRQELEIIATQSERISRVVARLLAVARPARATRAGSDVAQTVQEALAFLAPECRQRRIRTRMEMEMEVAAPSSTDEATAGCKAALDADRLFHIVFNLCLNAIEAQREDGDIVVRIFSRAGRSDGARKVAFEVEDHGPGVPADDAAHIFDAFFTSKGDLGGTGLGLAIVSGIAREAGGTVELVPTNHGGACFRVTLPADAVSAPLQSIEASA